METFKCFSVIGKALFDKCEKLDYIHRESVKAHIIHLF